MAAMYNKIPAKQNQFFTSNGQSSMEPLHSPSIASELEDTDQSKDT